MYGWTQFDAMGSAAEIGIATLLSLFLLAAAGSAIAAWCRARKARAAQGPEWYAGIPRSARVPTFLGFALMGISIFGFGAWASTALIAGAILAGGSFVATGENKIVQHFEGGVIKTIRVKEGDVVEKDSVLIELDETAPRAELRRLVLREARAVAMETRLIAEMNEQDDVTFPANIERQAGDPDIEEILAGEKRALKVRRNAVKTEISTLHEGIDALEQRIEGGNAQIAATRSQMEIIEEELAAKNQLLDQGLIRKPEVLTLKRARASLQGEIGRLTGEVGDARERISRIREQMVGVRNASVKSVVEQMHEISAELKDIRERIRSAKAVLGRSNVTAPVQGVVVRLQYHTAGGVIQPGKDIMEILPVQEELLIEAQIRPKDIDSVKQGQHAMIRLTALNKRITPMIGGEVVYVSADSLGSAAQRQPQAEPSDVYVARIKLNPLEVATVENFKPTPGMPVEVFIKTADRTFLDYLFKPISDSMAHAFREL